MTVVIGNTGLTVLQALATAEGMESTATLRYPEIIRKTKNGHRDTSLDIQGIIQEKAQDVDTNLTDLSYK
jgi:hypothetical protein